MKVLLHNQNTIWVKSSNFTPPTQGGIGWRTREIVIDKFSIIALVLTLTMWQIFAICDQWSDLVRNQLSSECIDWILSSNFFSQFLNHRKFYLRNEQGRFSKWWLVVSISLKWQELILTCSTLTILNCFYRPEGRKYIPESVCCTEHCYDYTTGKQVADVVSLPMTMVRAVKILENGKYVPKTITVNFGCYCKFVKVNSPGRWLTLLRCRDYDARKGA